MFVVAMLLTILASAVHEFMMGELGCALRIAWFVVVLYGAYRIVVPVDVFGVAAAAGWGLLHFVLMITFWLIFRALGERRYKPPPLP
jgi:hypothetical protein